MNNFFTVGSFATLGGCSTAAWIVTNVICGIFKWRQDLTGLIISLVVAYASVFLTPHRKLEQWVIAYFNGFLIYLTIVGGTSLIPKFSTQTTALVPQSQGDLRSAFTRPWIVDANLVAENRALQAADMRRQAEVADLRRANEEHLQKYNQLSGSVSVILAEKQLSKEQMMEKLRSLEEPDNK